MNNCPRLLDIFLVFLYIGAIMIGGGYVVLPILIEELVKKRSWLTDGELLNFYSISQALPGLIVVNTSLFIGYKLRGIFGAFSAIIGVTFAAFWSIVFLSSLIFNDVIFDYVSFAFKCIEIAVIILIYMSIKEIWTKSVYNSYSFIIFIFTLLLLFFFKLSPINVILITTFVGTSIYFFNHKRGEV